MTDPDGPTKAEVLREQAERLRLALAAGDIGTWDYYPEPGTLFWDERCKEIHGVAAEAVVSYDVFRQTIHRDDQQRVNDLIEHMLDPASGGFYVVEYRVIRQSDHVERWISVRGSVLFDQAGRATRFIGTTQDITEQRLAVETRERLLGIVGHDLRGPLSTIQMAANLLARDVELPKDRKRSVDVIMRSVDRMEAMIPQVLDYTRVRLGGGILLERKTVDLGALASQIIDEVGFARAGPRPVLEVQNDGVGFWDPTRLGQVLANLLHNALHYGAPEQPVVVSVRGRKSDVVLEVHNEGTAIPPALLPVLFEPFRRGASGAAHQQGLGLGLFIAHEIVLAHEGTLRVDSSPESGTTFRVELPREVHSEASPCGP